MRHLIGLLLLTSLLAACTEEDTPNTTDTGMSGDLGGDGGDLTPRDRWVDLIRGDRFPKLVLEIDHTEGLAFRSSVESSLVTALGGLLDKPGGITLTEDDTLAPRGSDYAWSFAELDSLARERFDLEVPSDTIRIHVLLLDGHYDKDTAQGKTLGLAWSHTYLVLFKDSLESACSQALLNTEQVCTEVELGVTLHEVGHLIGLVNNGLAMTADHEDPEHEGHDVNDTCLMYWAFESSIGVDRVVSQLTGGGSLDFDDACRNDIAAIRDAP